MVTGELDDELFQLLERKKGIIIWVPRAISVEIELRERGRGGGRKCNTFECFEKVANLSGFCMDGDGRQLGECRPVERS